MTFLVRVPAFATALLLACCAPANDSTVPPDAAGDPIVPGTPDAAVATLPPDAAVATLPPDAAVATLPPDAAVVAVPAELRVCASGATYATIGDAIAAAPADGATILVCPGIYAEKLVLEGKPVRIAGTGGAGVTILDAGGTGTALSIRGGAAVTVEGLTIRNGSAAIEGGGIRCELATLRLFDSAVLDSKGQGGGGLAALGCVVEIRGSRFVHNDGGERGGGALLVGASGLVSDNQFLDNVAVAGGGAAVIDGVVAVRRNEFRDNLAELRGGGLFLQGDGPVSGNTIAGNDAGWIGGGLLIAGHAPAVSDNTVSGNTSVNDGGGIYIDEGAPTLADNRVLDNESGDDGGGIRVFTSNAVLSGNLVERNRCIDGGGGIKVSHLPGLLVRNVVRDNEAVNTGGGLDLDNSSTVVRGGEITGNRASSGGGIFAMAAPWNDALIEGVTISGNRAWLGGGIHLSQNFQPITLRGLTLEGNEADQGGALYVRATHFTLAGSKVWRNVATLGAGLFFGASEPWIEACPCPPEDPTGTVRFTVFHDNQARHGAAIFTESLRLSVAGSILTGNGDTQVAVAAPPSAPGAMSWRYNDSLPATFAGMADPTGVDGNLAVDPLFVSAGEGDFQLEPGSPCADAADPALRDDDGTRADMGAYGGVE